MKYKLFILISFFLFLMSSCDELWLDNGEIITKEQKLDYFKEITINDIFDVELVQDTSHKIIIEGGSKLVNNLDININNSVLEIYNSSKSDWIHQYDRIKLFIHFKNIEKITLKESVNIISNDTIYSEKLTLHALTEYCDINLKLDIQNFHFANSESSAGVYILKGKANKFTCWVRGSGILKTLDLNAQSVYLRSQTISDCYVFAENDLTVMFENTGNIFYKGNPTIEIETPEYQDQLIKLEDN